MTGKFRGSLSALLALMVLSYSVAGRADQDQASAAEAPNDKVTDSKDHILYEYHDRSHSFKENAFHVSTLYAFGWMGYYISQPDVFVHQGSWRKYRNNFGKFVFDQDEPTWNWFIHPYAGSQVYLFYRSVGHSKSEALLMTFLQSALFEVATEIYTEPASIQDIYQTPILGSCLGFFLEHLSLSLLNSGYTVGKIIGHIINPMTLFWFYEGKGTIVPQISNTKGNGLTLYMDF